MFSFRCSPLWAIFLIVVGGASSSEAAYTTLYSNVTNYSGFAYNAGGARSVGGNVTTTLLADDITAGAGLGGAAVNQISFAAANLNSVNVSTSIELYLYAGNGSGGGPGSVITTVLFSPITLTADSVAVYTYTSTTSIFTMPSTLFWAGISFSNNFGTTGATAAQLNDLGLGIFNPPTVGTSENLFFQSTSAASNGTTNPAGGFEYFGGSPVANFGFAFAGTPAVAEPSSVILLAGGLTIVAAAVRRRRRPRSGPSPTENEPLG